MTDLILKLFFHGLVAFVPGNTNGSMTAYMVIHEDHSPTLAFELKGRTKCPEEPKEAPICTKEEDSPWCVCNISGFDLTFLQPALGAGQQIGNKTGAPTSQVDAGNSAWLVRLHSVNGKEVQVDPQKIPGKTSASIAFKWISERSCHLDQIGNDHCYPNPSPGCIFEIQAADFLNKQGQGSLKQALAEYASFDLRFLVLANFVTVVMLDRKKECAILDRRDECEIKIDLDCEDGICPNLLIGNGPPYSDETEDYGMHFESYYGLAYQGAVVYAPYRDEDAVRLVGDQQLHNCFGDPFRRRRI